MSIKVALLGNMNNNFFALCRYLRDEGYDARLFLLDEFGHFGPANDTFDEDYKTYVIETDWHRHFFFDPALKNKIKTALSGYDIVIGCDIAPAYMSLIGRRLDIFIPYGGDLTNYTLPVKLPAEKRLYRYLTFKRPVDPGMERVRHQLNGIKNAGCIIAENAYHTDAVIDKYFSQVKRYDFTLPMVYDVFKHITPQQLEQVKQNENISAYLKATEGKKVFFSHLRHSWISEKSQYLKGNDKIILAFAEYCKQYIDTVLVLFEYGVDVEESKKLVADAGIEPYVLWMPLMERKYILYMIKHADLCIGEIADSFVTYGVVLESIVMQTPLAHNYKEAAKASGYSTMYEAFNVTTAEEIKQVMLLVRDEQFDKQAMVTASRAWYQSAIVDKFLGAFKSIAARK